MSPYGYIERQGGEADKKNTFTGTAKATNYLVIDNRITDYVLFFSRPQSEGWPHPGV